MSPSRYDLALAGVSLVVPTAQAVGVSSICIMLVPKMFLSIDSWKNSGEFSPTEL